MIGYAIAIAVILLSVSFAHAGYWAKVENATVAQVIVADLPFTLTQPGLLVEVRPDRKGAIGYAWNGNIFIRPRPHPSWSFNGEDWSPPKPEPQGGGPYYWDEQLQDWVKQFPPGQSGNHSSAPQ